MLYWGVDSSRSVHQPSGSSRQTLFQRMNRWLSGINQGRRPQLPHFWGRYLSSTGQSHTRATPLTRDEITHILQESNQQCRILLIYVDASPGDMQTGGRQSGEQHAQLASILASGVLPHHGVGTCIYLDIEPGWCPTADWLVGWWQGIERTPYVSGVYCNLSHQNHALLQAYCEALRRPEVAQLTKTRYIWAPQPKFITNRNCRRPRATDLNQAGLVYPGLNAPHGLPYAYGGGQCRGAVQPQNDQVVLWQYWGNCDPVFNYFPPLANPSAGYFDMNLANIRGYGSLWH